MVYKDYYEPDELITPEEICDIMARAGTLDDAERGNAIASEYIQRNGEFVLLNSRNGESKWHWMWMCATIYEAGRLQGFRELRARSKAKAVAI